MIRRRIKDAEGGANGWLTTFNDLVTLLMVFFVLLFTMSSTEVGKLKQFQVSIMKGLGVLEKGAGSPVGVIESYGDKGSKRGMTRGKMIPEGTEDIEDYLESLKSFKGIDIRLSGEDQIMSLEGSALFQSGSADISTGAFPVLKELLKLITADSCRVRVEGHTDNIPIFTEKFDSNWGLSTARAVNIVKYLIEEGNVAPQRLSAVGYGELRPIVPNDSPRNRAKNRRVEVILEKGRRR
ncbi:MAG: flagellar motor protein MotB [Deltaproteobacteria bacterium]|nr:flagellar motor protein MotB [Deltaproteobacteria bacterium]